MTIVEELRQNRESGARRLEAEYKAGLMTLARRFCHDPGDAEELVNRTFAAVVEGIDDYLEQSAFFAWMCQILSNIHSMDVRRGEHKIVTFPGIVPDHHDEAATERIYDEVDASLLRDAVNRLPEEQRELLLLHYFMDMPVAKIARFLKIPQGTVMSRLYYARKALAAKMGAKAHEVAKKPGAKVVLLALLLCGLTALGAAVWNLAVSGEAQDQAEGGGRSPNVPQAQASGAARPEVSPYLGDFTDDFSTPQPSTFNRSTFNLSTFNDLTQGDIMNITSTSRATAMLASASLALAYAPAMAKTVALWPIKYDSTLTSFDGRCAIDATYNLTTEDGTEGIASDLGWSLPPNPDMSGMLFPPLNNAAIKGSRSGSSKYTMSAPNIAWALANTNAFTVEGWVKLAPNPSQSADYGLGKTWTILLQAGAGSANKYGGWILSWRGDEGARKFWLTVPADSGSANGYDAKIGPATLSAAFEDSMTNSWHHLALSHKVEGGQDVWKLYIDGENTIDGTEATVRKSRSGGYTLHTTYNGLYFGGRPESNANRINASFDYWRVTDEALEPTDFLCAAAPSPEAGESQVAYLAPSGSTGSSHSQWISTGVSLKGDARRTCTVEIWVYPLAMSFDHHLIEQYGYGSGRMSFIRRNSDGKLRVWLGDYAELVSSSEIPLNTWSHVAWVADGDTWRLYINGNLDAESTGHADHLLDATSADGFVIGNSRSSSPNGASNAYFAEARVWKCARTGAEINAAMNTRIADAWTMEDLVGYWPLNDGAVDYAFNDNRARNYAVLDSEAFTPAGNTTWTYAYAPGNRVGWASAALPVTGSLHGDQNVIKSTGLHTNAVNTQISATPDNFTFMGWYHVMVSSGSQNNYLCAKTIAANGRMQFHEVNGALRFWMGGGYSGKTNEEFIVENCMPVKRWAHVAVTKSANTVRIYVNGEMVGENGAFTMNLCTANLHLGGFDAISSRGGFVGGFKNVGFWSKVMSASAIRKHMTALPDPNDENLLGYWPLDEGDGDTVRNLKPGVEEGIPVSGGFFQWTKGANVPMVEGTVQNDCFVISIR